MNMVRLFFELFIMLIIADSIISFFPQARSHPVSKKLKEVMDYFLNPIRRALPANLPFDFSPLILILIVRVMMSLF